MKKAKYVKIKNPRTKRIVTINKTTGKIISSKKKPAKRKK